MEERTGGHSSEGSASGSQEEIERAQILFDSFPLPSFTWKRQGDEFFLLDFNEAAAVFTDGNASAYVGQPAAEIFADRPDIIDDIRLCFDSHSPITRGMTYSHPAVGGPFEVTVTYVYVPPDMVVVHIDQAGKRGP